MYYQFPILWIYIECMCLYVCLRLGPEWENRARWLIGYSGAIWAEVLMQSTGFDCDPSQFLHVFPLFTPAFPVTLLLSMKGINRFF